MKGLIRTYGLFWRADNVFWRKGTGSGSLFGVSAHARLSQNVDFGKQVGIYVLYEGHRIVYVGQTGAKNQRLFARLKGHRGDQLAGRWDRFSWFGLQGVLKSGALSAQKLQAGAPLNKTLDHIEAVLIATTEPLLNRQGGRFGQGAVQYLQVRDERLGFTQEEIIRNLWDIANTERKREK